MADYWVPHAQENDIVLVFPQVTKCWDVGDGEANSVGEFPNEIFLTQRGFQMNFMMQILLQIYKPLDKDYTYIPEQPTKLTLKEGTAGDLNAAARLEAKE